MSGPEDAAPFPAPKQDPETLVLRGRPRPVIRFRRGLIIGVTGTLTAVLVGLTWIALEPPSFRLAGDAEKPKPAAEADADGIADAPASYADVPQLGPPLPGDLGRPIVEHQRQAGLDASDPDHQAELDRQRQARQKLAQQAEAARTSAILVGLGSAAASEPRTIAAQAKPAEPPAEPVTAPPGAGRENDAGTANPHGERSAPTPWTLTAGTVVPAALITGINSDLPGIVLAQVTEPVRDSATGTAVLIPQGSRLIGAYDSKVAFGQRRALLIWQRIVFPDGSSVELDNVPAADVAGYSGLEGKADFHEWRLIKGVILSSLLGLGTEVSLGSEDSDLVRAIERSAERDGARAGDRIVSKNLEVQPTLIIRPGWPVRALLHKDLVLKPWKG